MGIEDDIREQFDASFGDGSRLTPADELVARGRRAVARRRLTAVGGAALAVVAISGTAVVAAGQPGGASGSAPGFADGPSVAAASPAPPVTKPSKPPTLREIRRALRDSLAEYDEHGTLVLDRGVVVVERIDDPYTVTGPGHSVALVLQQEGVRYWYALYTRSDGSSTTASVAAAGQHRTFASWVQQQRGIAEDHSATTAGPDVWPGTTDLDLVRFAGVGTERLEPVAGVTVLEQQPHVSVGDSFAGPGDQTAAAKVETAGGARYYVLARRFDGKQAQYIAVAESDGGPTLAAFLDLARQRYADGGGGLL